MSYCAVCGNYIGNPTGEHVCCAITTTAATFAQGADQMTSPADLPPLRPPTKIMSICTSEEYIILEAWARAYALAARAELEAEVERLNRRHVDDFTLIGQQNDWIVQRDERIKDVLISLAACNKRAEAAEARVKELEEQIALRDKALNARSIDKFNAVKRVEELERDYGLLRELASGFELERDSLRAKVDDLEKQLSAVNCDKAAFWEGHDSACAGVAARWQEALTMPIPAPGKMNEPLESLYRRTEALRARLDAINRKPANVVEACKMIEDLQGRITGLQTYVLGSPVESVAGRIERPELL